MSKRFNFTDNTINFEHLNKDKKIKLKNDEIVEDPLQIPPSPTTTSTTTTGLVVIPKFFHNNDDEQTDENNLETKMNLNQLQQAAALNGSSAAAEPKHNYYQCNLVKCGFKILKIFENRAKFLEHLKSHKFQSTKLEFVPSIQNSNELVSSTDAAADATAAYADAAASPTLEDVYSNLNTTILDELSEDKPILLSNDEQSPSVVVIKEKGLEVVVKKLPTIHDKIKLEQIDALNRPRKLPTLKGNLNLSKKIQTIRNDSLRSREMCTSDKSFIFLVDDVITKVHRAPQNLTNDSENIATAAQQKSFNKKPYFFCDKCEVRFTHRSSYEKHNLSQHSEVIAIDDKTGERLDGKQRICTHCSQVFSRASVLNQHFLTVHLKQKPFECDYCQKRFAAKSNLTEHTRIHTGSKPYKCPDCDKNFSYRSTLTTHIKNVHHTNMLNFDNLPILEDDISPLVTTDMRRSYICNFCTRNFSSKVDVIRHMMQVHKVNSVTSICQIDETLNEDITKNYSVGSIIKIPSPPSNTQNLDHITQPNEFEVKNEVIIPTIKIENNSVETLDISYDKIENDDGEYLCEENFIATETCNTENFAIGTFENVYTENSSNLLEENNIAKNCTEKEPENEFDEDDVENCLNTSIVKLDGSVEYIDQNAADDIPLNDDSEIYEVEYLEDYEVDDNDSNRSISISKNSDTYEVNEKTVGNEAAQLEETPLADLAKLFVDPKNPRRCIDCNVIFSRPAVLYQHIKIVHFKIKSYSCQYCNKTFGASSNLSEHERIHTGEKPYKCIAEFCNKAFSRRTAFVHHVKTNHPYNITELIRNSNTNVK